MFHIEDIDDFNSDTSLEQLDEISSRARKNLCVGHLKGDDKIKLNLPKFVIQTILKKQYPHGVSRSLVSEKRLLSYGLCPQKLKIFPSHNPGFPRSPSNKELRRYGQIISSNKTIKSLEVVIMGRLPPPFLKAIGALQSLQALEITLIPSQFIIFSVVLGSLRNLRILIFEARKPHFTKKRTDQSIIELAIQNFGKNLLSRKYLEKVSLDISGEILKSEENTIKLLSPLAELDRVKFKVLLKVNQKRVSYLSQAKRFLQKVQFVSLSYHNFYLSSESSAHNNVLMLKVKNLTNFGAVLELCPELKILKFRSSAIGEQIPMSLGLAENLEEFDFTSHSTEHQQTPEKLFHLLQNAINLQTLRITVWSEILESWGFAQKNVLIPHLKNYELTISSTHFPCDSDSAKILLESITKFQSLENLKINLLNISDVDPLKAVFAGFPKIKKLSVSIARIFVLGFPVESLAKLDSVEELTIFYCALTNKEEFLQRFPRLKSLKHLAVSRYNNHNFKPEITMEDYKKKFLLN